MFAETTWAGLSDRLVGLMTRDYFPATSRVLRRWAKNPLAVLCYALVVALLCGVVLHPQGFVVAAGLFLVILVGLFWPWLSVLGLSGKVGFDRTRSREGEATGVVMTLRNRAPWTAWGLAMRGDSGFEAGVARIGGSRQIELTWSFVAGCRGCYPRDGLRLVTGFPFGLRECSRRLKVERPLMVWPRTFPVGPIPEGAGEREGDGGVVRRRAGCDGELMGVRPYRRGDSLRRVHWGQTARTGELIVCELNATAVPTVQIVLDTDIGGYEGTGPDGAFEWAVRVAASFAEGWNAQGAQVELVAGGQALRPRGHSVESRRTELLDSLAKLEAGPEVGLPEVLSGLWSREFGGGLRVVVCSDRAWKGLKARVGRGVTERFVVLGGEAFGGTKSAGGATDPGHGSRRPWIWLDDPSSVPQALRRGWKEVTGVA